MDDMREHISSSGGGAETSQGNRMSGCLVSLLPGLLIIAVIALALLGAISVWVVVPIVAALVKSMRWAPSPIYGTPASIIIRDTSFIARRWGI